MNRATILTRKDNKLSADANRMDRIRTVFA